MGVSHHIQYRVNVEQTILGMCMLENGFARIADYLIPGNFSDADMEKGILVSHKAIYSAFTALYPTQPVNLISVAKNEGWAYYCSSITASVSSASDIRYHAGQLLEFNIRDQFLTLLNALSETGDNIAKIALNEIIDETLDYDNDLLQLIDKAVEHLQNKGCYASSERVAQFSNQIDTKARKIKDLSSVDCLINNLSRLKNSANDRNTQMAIDHLADLIKVVMVKPTLSQTELSNILKASI